MTLNNCIPERALKLATEGLNLKTMNLSPGSQGCVKPGCKDNNILLLKKAHSTAKPLWNEDLFFVREREILCI